MAGIVVCTGTLVFEPFGGTWTAGSVTSPAIVKVSGNLAGPLFAAGAGDQLGQLLGSTTNGGFGYYSSTTSEHIIINSNLGHISAPGGTAPTYSINGGAGSGATCSISGNDTCFQVTLTTGSGTSAGTLVGWTNANGYHATPFAVGCGQTAVAAGIEPYFLAWSSTEGLIGCNVAPAVGTEYQFTIFQIGR